MSETPSLSDIFEPWANSDADPDDVAESILSDVLSHPDATTILRPAVAAYFTVLRRSAVRRVERATFERRADTAVTTGTTTARLALLAELVFVPGRGLVPWGDATGDDHAARIDMLAAKRDGLADTISRHERALKVLDATGMETLNDAFVADPELVDSLLAA